ncbi:unnamed protein product [Blepharisma stoltei]|uniref:C2H2-type domain-containing protein n=1 Tax=Blepharisma stoltei TaxID=1481888 RepID=A0AAU9JGB5_9CILI|nr:unnamed protein product [Blepharisma stoltei]
MKKDATSYKFKCYYTNCDKAYLTKYHLRRHINAAHLQIKSFVCSQCSKAFSSKQNFKEHELLHAANKNSPSRTDMLKPLSSPSETKARSLLSLLAIISHQQEEPVKPTKSNARNKPMPVLPPVDSERQSQWGLIKIPILPILLS